MVAAGADRGATGDTADAGQAAYGGDHTRQDRALLTSTDRQEEQAKADNMLLVGDFDCHEQQDPILAITAAGYIDQITETGKQTWVFNRTVGSLDHVFASVAANHSVSTTDVWNIN